jgi:hypothetical protein
MDYMLRLTTWGGIRASLLYFREANCCDLFALNYFTNTALLYSVEAPDERLLFEG